VVRVCAVTHPGLQRAANEDTLTVAGWSASRGDVAPFDMVVATKHPLLTAVADGLGGHAEGETASRLAIDTLNANSHRMGSPAGVAAVLLEANEAIFTYSSSHREAEAMGSTVAGLAIVGGAACVFSVGDSSVFRIVDGYAGLLSTSDRAALMPGQPAGSVSHLVGQCLGGSSMLSAIDPHVYSIELQEAERYLICSDGLTDVVPATEIGSIVVLELPRATAQLLATALEAGAPDNISIILIEIVSVPPAAENGGGSLEYAK